jgi:hypothetical protein
MKAVTMIKKCKKNMISSVIKKTFTYAIMLTFASCISQNKEDLKTGVYDNGNLRISIRNGIELTGVISIEEEIECKLFISGKLTKDSISELIIYNPADGKYSKGQLNYSENSIKILSREVLFPCQRVIDLSSGETFYSTSGTTEQNFMYGMITSPRSFLYTEPSKQTAKKSYLIKGDVITIYEEKVEWIKIKYKENGLFYWIKLQDITAGR